LNSVPACSRLPLPVQKLFSSLNVTAVPPPMSSLPVKPRRDGARLPPPSCTARPPRTLPSALVVC